MLALHNKRFPAKYRSPFLPKNDGRRFVRVAFGYKRQTGSSVSVS